MSDLFYRTEDIRPEEVLNYFVETNTDREIVNSLKNRNPTIIVGSRGIGKSFLLRTAEAELISRFEVDRVFPIYLTFVKSSLVQASNAHSFQNWMLAKICSKVIRELNKHGLLIKNSLSLSKLTGDLGGANSAKTKLEEVMKAFEESYQNPSQVVDVTAVPSVEIFKEAIEDLCETLNINRISLFIDEAAHIFIPSQQRDFFTLFRDLRGPYLTCNAAVYPGVTTYGDTFQPVHDATIIPIERDVTSDSYIDNMREIVQKQADSRLIAQITRRGQNFAVLAFAANGNPRILLKTLNLAPDLSITKINEVIREYYRTDIWSEHSLLSEKYTGHRFLIDWGRNFIEQTVLPELYKKNLSYLASDKKTSAFFWIHRDAPHSVKEALRILSYTGLVVEHASGIKATRSEIGTRYMVNLGCLFSMDASPGQAAFEIAKNLTIKRMSEFGANHSSFNSIAESSIVAEDRDNLIDIFNVQLQKSIDVLDIPNWQKSALKEQGILTIKIILSSPEALLKKAFYIGDVRSRRIKNAALASVYEYISG